MPLSFLHANKGVQKKLQPKEGKGFTLIELLLVIGVIAILASIVIVAINPTANIQAAQNRATQKQAREISNAIFQHIIQHGVAPSGITDVPQVLCSDGFVPADGDCEITLKDALANESDGNYSFIAQIPRAANAVQSNLPPENSGFRVSTDGVRYTVTEVIGSVDSSTEVSCIEGANNPLSIGSSPRAAGTLVGDNLYITARTSADLTVIDTTTDTVTTTVGLGAVPVYAPTAVGTDLYIVEGNDLNLGVVDTTTNTKTTSIYMGIQNTISGSPVLVDDKLYAPIGARDQVNVIDTTTNTLLGSIAVGDNPNSTPTVVGTDLYVSNQNDNTVSVIDTSTDTVTTTINLAASPTGSTLVGTDLYVPNGNTVSVIDTTTNTVITTVALGPVPAGGTVSGTKFYVPYSFIGNNKLAIIDSATDTVTATLDVGSVPVSYPTAVGNKMYVVNRDGNSVSIVDLENDALCS